MRLDIALAALVFLVLCVAILLGHSWLELWSQVRDWWVNDWPLFGWDYPQPIPDPNPDAGVVDHTHFLRRTLTYPFFWLGLKTGIDPHHLYTAVLPFLAGGTVLFSALAVRASTGHELSRVSAIVLFPVGLLFLEMHGRIPLAYFGFALVLWMAMRPGPMLAPLSLVSAGIGLFFTGVSSGTLLNAIAIYCAIAGYRAFRDRTWSPVIAALILAVLFAYPIFSGIVKNLRFYGGGVDGMIGISRHGLGGLFLAEDISILSLFGLALAATAGIGLLLFFLRRVPYPLPVIAVLINLPMGILGLTIFVLAIIPIAIACAAHLDHWLHGKAPRGG